MIDAVLGTIAGGLVLVTLLPFSRNEIWWIRCWDFPRLQLAVVALILAMVSLLRLESSGAVAGIVLLAALACFVVHTALILPYTVLARCEVKPAREQDQARRLRILAANVLMTNRKTGRFLALVRELQPDIVVAVEGDDRWQQALDSLEPEYPHTVKLPRPNAYGMHVYSRLPLRDARAEFLVEADVPSIHATLVLRSGDAVRVHFLHPAPPSPSENESSAERDAELVLVAKRVAKEQGPVVVSGDLNDVAWSATTKLFCKLSRLLDPRIGRGMFNTFHARWFFARWPLDHLFHSDDFTLVEMRRLPGIGSDHFPFLVELALEPDRAATQEAPRADHEDHAMAEEKVGPAREGT